MYVHTYRPLISPLLFYLPIPQHSISVLPSSLPAPSYSSLSLHPKPSSSSLSLQINLIELNEQRENAITARQLAILNEDRRERALRKERRLSTFCFLPFFLFDFLYYIMLSNFLKNSFFYLFLSVCTKTY
jgi:hypothetical protein